jgi:hypothetical protein
MHAADPTVGYFALTAFGIVFCAIPLTLLMPRLLGWRILGVMCIVCGVLFAVVRVSERSREPARPPLTMVVIGAAIYLVARFAGTNSNDANEQSTDRPS